LGLVAVEWAESQLELDAYLAKLKLPVESNQKKIAPYAKELREYLSGKRTTFTIPIDWTHFTPYRAVGAANAMNPMPIIIPCHRVLGADGKLHGYGGKGGLKTKEWLLKFEGAMMA
jgi:O-6-methylguanine DNA methyltransferase